MGDHQGEPQPIDRLGVTLLLLGIIGIVGVLVILACAGWLTP